MKRLTAATFIVTLAILMGGCTQPLDTISSYNEEGIGVGAVTALAAPTETQWYGSPFSYAPDGTIGQVPWSGLIYALGLDGQFATVNLAPGKASYFLMLTNYHVSIPIGTHPVGIQAQATRKASKANAILDYDIRIVCGNLPRAGYRMTNPYTWSTSVTAILYGSKGFNFNWGAYCRSFLPLTRADVMDSGFGIALSVKNYASTTVTASVDGIEVKVWYAND